MAKDVLAIIPARGGSKGLPRKNVLMLGDRPLIAHSIAAARAATRVTRVVVSTDDAEIAAVARQYGAEVVDRPAAIAGDVARSEEALLHVLSHLDATERYRPELTVFLQCTSPLTSADDIDGTIAALVDGDADSALAVTAFHYFLWRDDGAGGGTGVNHDKAVRPMRQQRDPEYLETGAVYVMRTDGFLAARHRFFGRTVLFDTPAERRLEIDELEDFRVAEERIARLARGRTAAVLPDRPAAIVMDFDGVFTDDRVFVDQDGRETVACSRSDGMGIERLRKAGIAMMVVSKEANPVVAARCRKLKLDHHHGIDDKLPLVRDWLDGHGHDPARTLYVGNDINDLDCMRFVGCAVAPRDAHPSALAVADLVLDADGGRGALRRLADMILERQDRAG